MPISSHLSKALASVALLFALTACSVNVKKNEEGGDKNVDIKTPFGGIHVNENADVRDTGLPVYPGAKPKPKDDSQDEKSANVDISTSAFGLKVVAVDYESDDAPGKLIAFYQDHLKQFGKVLECHSSGHNYNYRGDRHNNGSEELKCDGDSNGSTIELKAGTENNQHIVSIKPSGKGSDLGLVYVRVRGKEGTI